MFPNPANVVPDHLIDPRLRQANSYASHPPPVCSVDQNWPGFIDLSEFTSAPHAAGSLGTGGASGTEVNSPPSFYNQPEAQPSAMLGPYGFEHGPSRSFPTSPQWPIPPCGTEGAGMASSGIYPVSSLQQSGGPTASAFWPYSDFSYPVTGAYGISPYGNAAPTPLNGFPSHMFDHAMPGGHFLEHPDPDPSTPTGPPKEFLRAIVIRDEPIPKGSTIWSATRMDLTINGWATTCLGVNRPIVLTNREDGLYATGFATQSSRNSVEIKRGEPGSILNASGKDLLTLVCFEKRMEPFRFTFELGLLGEITLINRRSTNTLSRDAEESEYNLDRMGVRMPRDKTTEACFSWPKPTQWYQMGELSYVKPAS